MKNNTNKDYIYSNAKLHYTLKVMRLLNNGKKKVVRSGHDIHFEKPRHFLNAMKMLEKML